MADTPLPRDGSAASAHSGTNTGTGTGTGKSIGPPLPDKARFPAPNQRDFPDTEPGKYSHGRSRNPLPIRSRNPATFLHLSAKLRHLIHTGGSMTKRHFSSSLISSRLRRPPHGTVRNTLEWDVPATRTPMAHPSRAAPICTHRTCTHCSRREPIPDTRAAHVWISKPAVDKAKPRAHLSMTRGFATIQVFNAAAYVSSQVEWLYQALGALTSAGRAFLAVSTTALKAVGSLTASSASCLRLTSTPAKLRPWMKRL